MAWRRARWVGVGVCACALGHAADARAVDVAGAEVLFRRGRADLLEGKYATACPALAESQRLDPRPGTMFTLAECEARAGRTATAVARYREYLDMVARLGPEQQARHRARVKDAEAAAVALAPTVPELTIVLAPDAPPDAVVERDGTVVGAVSMGLAMPVDPGEHVVVLRTAGGARVERRVRLENGERKRIDLGAPPAATGPAPAPASTAKAGAGGALRAWGFAVGGVGVVGVVVGAVAGGMALGEKGTMTAECDEATRLCSRDGKVAADRAQSLALASSVAFGVGVAGLAAGGVLLLVARPRAAAAARPVTVGVSGGAPGAVELRVGGAF